MTNPPPVAPVVTDEMVDAGLEKWFESESEELAELKADSNFWNYYRREMRAAITAALEATGELERLRAALQNIRALAAKRQHEGGPDGNLKAVEEFAVYGLEGKNP